MNKFKVIVWTTKLGINYSKTIFFYIHLLFYKIELNYSVSKPRPCAHGSVAPDNISLRSFGEEFYNIIILYGAEYLW